MHKFLLFSFLLSFALPLLGQEQIRHAIYFESGQASLSAQAEQSLDSFFQVLHNRDIGSWRIMGFTDDVGSVEYNIGLSLRRAQTARKALQAKGLKIGEESLQALGKQESKDAQSRSKNRRVEIYAQVLKGSDSYSFFQFFRKEALQTGWYNPTADIYIQGKKGGEIFIPAYALQTAEGQAVEELVRIELIEAYSKSDILLQNLQSQSPQGLLQTGGMICVEAYTKQGQKLKLNAQKPMRIAMPAEKPMLEGMQVFLANRSGEEQNQAISWDLQGNAFKERKKQVSNAIQRVEAINLFGLDFQASKHQVEQWEALPELMPKPQEPKMPHLRSSNLPDTSFEGLAKKDPRKFLETKKSYEARIAQRQKTRIKQYLRNEKQNAEYQEAYQEQMLAYKEALKKYQKDLQVYAQYEEDVRRVLEYWHVQISQGNQGIERFGDFFQKQIGQLGNKFGELADQRFSDKKLEVLRLLYHVEKTDWAQELETKRFGVKELLPERYPEFKQHLALLRAKHRQLHKLLDPAYSTLIMLCKRANVKVSGIAAESLAIQLAAAPELDLQFIYELQTQLLAIPTALQEAEAFILREVGEQPAYLKDFELAFEKELQNINTWVNKTNTYCLRNGHFSGDVAARAFLYEAVSPTLGWINCDRFLRTNKPKTRLVLAAGPEKQGEETLWFAVFPEMDAVLNITRTDGQGNYVSDPIDVDTKVKIIGLRFNSQEEGFAVCSIEGISQDIQGTKAVFKKSTIGSFEDALAAIN